MTELAGNPWLGRILRIAGVALLVTALCPSLTGRGGPGDESERWWLGLQGSPLFVYERSSTEVPEASGAPGAPGTPGRRVREESSSTSFHFFSWSMAALVCGVALLAAARAARK